MYPTGGSKVVEEEPTGYRAVWKTTVFSLERGPSASPSAKLHCKWVSMGAAMLS